MGKASVEEVQPLRAEEKMVIRQKCISVNFDKLQGIRKKKIIAWAFRFKKTIYLCWCQESVRQLLIQLVAQKKRKKKQKRTNFMTVFWQFSVLVTIKAAQGTRLPGGIKNLIATTMLEQELLQIEHSQGLPYSPIFTHKTPIHNFH